MLRPVAIAASCTTTSAGSNMKEVILEEVRPRKRWGGARTRTLSRVMTKRLDSSWKHFILLRCKFSFENYRPINIIIIIIMIIIKIIIIIIIQDITERFRIRLKIYAKGKSRFSLYWRCFIFDSNAKTLIEESLIEESWYNSKEPNIRSNELTKSPEPIQC